MKLMIEKLTLSENTSFVARTYRTPNFEVPWHSHAEYELILFTEGYGKCYIGNYIGDFTIGDVFFIGSNLPHTFQKAEKDLVTSAVVVQFSEDFLGEHFLHIPEAKPVKKLFEIANQGLKIADGCNTELSLLISALENAKDFSRIIKLFECFELMANESHHKSLSTPYLDAVNFQQNKIDAIFKYTQQNFQQEIKLSEVAKIACMSISAFCMYFRKSTKKTYINFVNELRVGYACKLLIDTQKDIMGICYESGFNTLTNFHKQFLKVKLTTPSAYRKNFNEQLDQVTNAQQTDRSLAETDPIQKSKISLSKLSQTFYS
ncbi:helix-turn-helix domain-containing protein [Pedobacter sp. ISL-68]|uniref:AraC family transcriptional regulator n=1 Tax=unclassified Pedobacter TaxID=2628915 RepID=UPI001BEC45F6|nr:MULTISPECIES: AraC family transcriptional regulator [unclassified Pedobacter]MBT2564782.1 helix-turn-helix domain-containing protein [Pedobacter sp. ISL-64]MBT2593649.1 helix-turn-helix domain-containing protein [Pedobacter sp. ISL-68]